MRAWLVAIVVLVACKGKDKDPAKDLAKVESKPAVAVSTVKVATVLAKDEARPPFLYLVDDAGSVKLAAAKTWADLDANTLKIAKRSTRPGGVDRFVREAYAMGRETVEAVGGWDEATEVDLTALDDIANGAAKDDPPPPPPEEDGDESGGTGTAMALDEGRMGKKDSERAEGQYKMKKNDEDPQLARQQAIEQARTAGVLGTVASAGAGGAVGRGIPNVDGMPSRNVDVVGAVMRDGKLERLRAMILIAPTAKASTLIDVVRETDAAIAVSFNGKLRPLHVQFESRDATPTSQSWLEARVSAKGLVVEAVPDKPLEVAALDQLGATIDKARVARGLEKDAPVDVLVDPDVDVQRLVDVVVALDLANVTIIGMGKALTAEELARRGHRIPSTMIGQPNTQGDLDKSEIRRVIKAAKGKITLCYEKALMTAPSLGGTVMTQFFINPDGKVGGAAASGVSPEVANCIGGVIKSLTFPKPKSGGGVQVNYPFTLRT